MKKVFALLLTLALIFSLSVPAFAVNSDGESYVKGSITIKNPQEGATYKAYKIFDVTYDLGNEGATDDKYAYTIASEWVNDVVAYATPANTTLAADWTDTTANGMTVTKVLNSAGTITAYNVTINKDTFSAADFGEKMSNARSGKNGIAFSGAKIENLDLGYYMVEPTSGPALVSLTTTDKDVTVSDKNEMPVVDKKLDGEERALVCKKQSTDSTAENYEEGHEHSEANGCYAEKNYTTKSVGDKVDFELDTKVPDMTGYETYFFVMNDTMTAGLTFNNDVVITLDGTTLGSDKYTVKVTGGGDADTNIRIVFNNMKQWWSNDDSLDKAGKPIVIKYSATVDEDAVMGTSGNTNTAKIEYSNNPNIVPQWTDPEEPDPENPGDKNDPLDPNYKHNGTDTTTDDPTGVSAEDSVKVYTVELDITKVDAASPTTLLKGAKFKIEGEKLNVSIVNKTIFEEDNTNGTWYRLKDGTYTEESPDKNGENKTTYTKMGADFKPVTFEEVTEGDPAQNPNLYYSIDGITYYINSAGMPLSSSVKFYRPTYHTVGFYYDEGEGDYTEITESNAASNEVIVNINNYRQYYKATVWKQSDLYEDTTKKYTKVEVITKENTGAGKYTAEGFVDENGKITFAGLAEGTYKLTELIAPDGYNILKAPVEVVIALVADDAGSYAFQAIVDGAETPVSETNGVLSFNIANSQGVELPETGGIGTTLFYVLGTLLVLGAGILLVAKKRMGND